MNTASGDSTSRGYAIRVGLLMLGVLTPTAYRAERGVLIAMALALLALAVAFDGRLRLHRTVVLWALVCGAVGGAYMVWGGFNGAPGVPRVGTVYVLWPLVLTFSLAAFATLSAQWWAARGLLVAQALIALYGLSYVLFTAGILPSWAYVPLDLDQSISLSGGFVEISFDSLNSLIFLVPFSIAALMVWTHRSPFRAMLTTCSVVLGVFLAVISGRRALQLVVVLAPLLCLLFVLPASREVRRLAYVRGAALLGAGVASLLIAAVAVLELLDLDAAVLWKAFTGGFEAADDMAENPRVAQLLVLLAEFSTQPLFGHGLGAAASGIVRSAEQPWAYELSYVALLFQVGVVGFAFYLIAVGWIYFQAIRIVRRDPAAAPLMMPMLVGMSAFLIANATNPYLAAFDYLWILFLPLAIVNGSLLRRIPEPAESPSEAEAAPA